MQANTAINSQVRQNPPPRLPLRLDYLLFFIAIPVGLALIFSLVGVRLTNGMPWLDAFGYLILHMAITWYGVSLGSYLVWYSCKSWQPPTVAICMIGYVIAFVPTAFVYQLVGDVFAAIYPSFEINRTDAPPDWNLEYLLHVIRFSIPAIPIYLAGVLGYRYVTGVDWFGYPSANDAASGTDNAINRSAPMAGLIADSKLPADSEIIAIKAEQHYINIWSSNGEDLVRFRFKDLDTALEGTTAIKVHRSWWVNYKKVSGWENSGRTIELTLQGDTKVPVSLANKAAVLARIT